MTHTVGALVKIKSLEVTGRIDKKSPNGYQIKYTKKRDKYTGIHPKEDLEVIAPSGCGKCLVCGKIFKKKNGNSQYCSKWCRGKIKKCTRCSEKYKAKSPTAKYCKICRKEVQAERTRVSNSFGVDVTDDQLIYPDYKEPLRKVEEGYGYLGTVAYTKDRNLVQCHICGKAFKSIGSHCYNVHGLTIKEYKEKFQLNQGTSLIGNSTKEKLIKTYEKSNRKFLKHRKKYNNSEANIRQAREQAKKAKGKKLSLEYRNKNGTCPDQMKDKFMKLKNKLGRVPTVREFKGEYGNGIAGAVYWHYGNWNKFVNMFGFKTQLQKTRDEYCDGMLIKNLQDFFEETGRSPRQADLQRRGKYTETTYRRRFGSLNKARMKAGIPIVVEIRRGVWGETMDYDKYFL